MEKTKEIKSDKKVMDTDRIKRVVNRLAETQDGQEFLNYLMRSCGFCVSSLVIDVNTSEINTISSIYNEARKTIYYDIRRLLDKEKISKIEYLQIKEDADNDN